MNEDFHRKYRPMKFKEVVGQDAVVTALEKLIDSDSLPHSNIFFGPSGCGKTTLARVLRYELNCSDLDYNEINAANYRGIDMAKSIQEGASRACNGKGQARVYTIDEAHQMTKEAQNCLLKLFEEPPAHTYFFLCTTDPGKLLPTVQKRCRKFEIKAIKKEALKELVVDIAGLEKTKLDKEVVDRIVETAEGCGREALILLQSVVGLDNVQSQLDAIEQTKFRAKAIELAWALIGYRGKPTWANIRTLLESIEEEPESVRRMILTSASNEMMKPTTKHAQQCLAIIQIFRDHFYDCGKAGLVASCYEVATRSKQ